MSKKKLILIIILGIIILIIGLIAVYFLFLKKPAKISPPTTEFPESGIPASSETFKPQPKKRLIKISETTAISPTIKNNSIIYYSPEGAFESNFDGSNLKKFSSIVIPNLIEVLWSNDASKALILNYDDNYNIGRYIYDYSISKAYPIPNDIHFITFSPDGNQIIYNRNSSIYIANLDFTNPTIILSNFQIDDAVLNWISSEKILIKTPPSGLVSSFALIYDLKVKELKLLLENLNGLNIKSSFDKTNILYSSTDSDGKNISLAVINSNSQNKKNLNIKTLADKCVFSQDNRTIFCAVPREIPDDAILPDDYYKDKIDFTDDIWRINIETGEKKLIEGIDIDINADNLLLSPQENYLFFINKKDGNLYSLKL